MIDELSEEEQHMLSGARRGLSPTPADAERVLAATMLSVAVPAVASIAHASATTQTGAAAPTAAGAVPIASAGKAIAALALAALTGVIGYQLGYHAAEREHVPAARRPAAERVAVEHAPAPSPGVSQPASPAASPQAPIATPDAVLSHPATLRMHAGLAAKSAANDQLGPDKLSRSLTQPQGEPAEVETIVAGSLERELQALRKIERALRANDASLALELIDALDRDVPHGTLLEERAATTALARCALGLGRKLHLRSEFIDAYPTSVYRSRVEQSCADATTR